MIISLVPLLGLASLAVDFGHVQIAKMQLEQMVDAAARYASTGVSDGTYLTKAQAVASENRVDGLALTLPAANVISGMWSNGTFTAGGASPNAIKVTAERSAQNGNPITLLLGSIVGVASMDIHATAIASITSTTPTYGFVGLNSINLSGSWIGDSYNSASGAYNSAARNSNATMATNGNVNANGGAKLYGDLYYKSGYSSNGGSGPVSPNSAKVLSGTLSYANPTLPATYNSMGNFNGNSGSSSLGTGDYYYQSFNVNSGYTLNITGQVNIYVGGNVNIGGTINTLNNVPNNLHIYTVQSSGVNISGNASLYADIYAPNSPINVNGSGQFFGRAIGSQISISGSGQWHYDESLSSSSSGNGVISTVR